ncbi:MAG: PIN domain-containing protein [Deltaproteobacteria bacterium]|nr:PIN domain-containing protein [Deltaproteobacteria bacterium]
MIEAIGRGPVAIDTAPFIYFIEENPQFIEPVSALFQAVDRGAFAAVTSGVTLLECLVIPYRTGDHTLAARYEALLTGSRGLTLIDIDRPLVRAAAQLRAATGVRTPDALQVAAALSANATAFVTNDRKLPTVSGLQVLQLADF